MDPIADMLTRIRNASAVKNPTVITLCSGVTQAIADILQREGWVQGVVKHVKKTKRTLEITLAYTKDEPVITGVRRISKPSRRVYKGWRELRSVRQGYGIAIISTPKGLLTDREARKQKTGGEVLFEVW